VQPSQGRACRMPPGERRCCGILEEWGQVSTHQTLAAEEAGGTTDGNDSETPEADRRPGSPDFGPDLARAGEEGPGLRGRTRDDGRGRAHGGTARDEQEERPKSANKRQRRTRTWGYR